MNTKEMRIDILRMALAAKSQGAHLGGSLSMVEIMAALYGSVMKLDPGNMENNTVTGSSSARAWSDGTVRRPEAAGASY